MLTPETALQKIKQLSSEQQKQVFELIESFDKQQEEAEDFFEIAGIWKDRDITTKTLRQEAWKEQNQ